MLLFVAERSTNGDNGIQVDNEMSRTTTEDLASPHEATRGRHHSGGSAQAEAARHRTSPRERSRSPLRSSPAASCSPRPLSPSRVEQAEPAARYAAEHAIKVSSEAAKHSSPPHSPKVPTTHQLGSSLHQAPPASTSSRLPPSQLSPGFKGQNGGMPSGNPFDQQNPAALASALAAMQGQQNPMQVRTTSTKPYF